MPRAAAHPSQSLNVKGASTKQGAQSSRQHRAGYDTKPRAGKLKHASCWEPFTPPTRLCPSPAPRTAQVLQQQLDLLHPRVQGAPAGTMPLSSPLPPETGGHGGAVRG